LNIPYHNPRKVVAALFNIADFENKCAASHFHGVFDRLVGIDNTILVGPEIAGEPTAETKEIDERVFGFGQDLVGIGTSGRIVVDHVMDIAAAIGSLVC